MRIGAKKRPFYRVVAVDERKKRTGAYLENLGTYNPLTQPHEILLKQDRIDDWLKKGAVESDGFLRITGKAPQRPPRKPKKAQEEKPEIQKSLGNQETKSEQPESTTQPNEDMEISDPKTPAESIPSEPTPDIEDSTHSNSIDYQSETPEDEINKSE